MIFIGTWTWGMVRSDHRTKTISVLRCEACMDERVQGILRRIADTCLEIFSEDLIGVYVHGSLAFGCFNWSKSDIDFIVVVQSLPDLSQKELLIEKLLGIDACGPSKSVEMSLVLERYTRSFVYPTPYELHFSHAHKQEFLDDPTGYSRHMNGVDRDLAAHFTVI